MYETKVHLKCGACDKPTETHVGQIQAHFWVNDTLSFRCEHCKTYSYCTKSQWNHAKWLYDNQESTMREHSGNNADLLRRQQAE